MEAESSWMEPRGEAFLPTQKPDPMAVSLPLSQRALSSFILKKQSKARETEAHVLQEVQSPLQHLRGLFSPRKGIVGWLSFLHSQFCRGPSTFAGTLWPLTPATHSELDTTVFYYSSITRPRDCVRQRDCSTEREMTPHSRFSLPIL